jgi:hypothetical protein
MSSPSHRTRIDGTTRTRTGRVVYNRKPHLFSGRDAARVTRQALDFLRYSYGVWTGEGLSKKDVYSVYHFQKFCDWAGAWNFFPESMIEEVGNESEIEDYAVELGFKIASWLGLPDFAVDLGSWFYGEFISGKFSASFKVKREFSSMIVMGVKKNTKTEGELYGHEKQRF